jgi:hypothetical protein
MTSIRSRALVAAVLLSAAAGLAGTARAHGDHDAPGANASAASAAPRLVAESDAFELVGVLENGTRLRLWLDRWADNAPVRDARIELEIGSTKLVATPEKDAVGYIATLPAPLPEGVHPVTVALTAGAESDLLAGELDVHTAPPAGTTRAAADTHRLPLHLDALSGWWVAAIAVGIVALTAAILFFMRARRARRSLA